MGSVNCKEFSINSTHDQQTTNDGTTYKSNCDEMVNQQPESDFLEKIVCNESDINENEMKQFDMTEDSKILLVKQKGKITAIGNKCSHYGALLSTGALSEGRVRCPWHGACFNIETGDIEDFPGLDSIPCYKVDIVAGQVKVRAKQTDLEKNKLQKSMVHKDKTNDTTFIIIGGGPSAAVCCETLRQEGFTGRIVMICKENYLPYDRIRVSKVMDFDIHKAEYRTNDFYEEYDIEAMTGVEATNVNSHEKTVSLNNGYIIKYDKIYIATGCEARKIPIPGSDLSHVVTMRNYTDAKYVFDLLRPSFKVVCFGLSFISLEAAAYCIKRVSSVTVIGRDKVPLRQSFGPELGQRIKELFEENHVNFLLENEIKRFIDVKGMLQSVELNNGEILPCDLCIMGVGSNFNTKFLQSPSSGLELNRDGSINTNIYLQSNNPDIYVGGDIANAPVYSIDNERATIGHIGLAQYHGRIAAKNMVLNNTIELHAVPFFWTMIFGKSFRYSGYGTPYETHIIGSLPDLKFVAFYFDKNGNVCGLASCQRDPIVAQYAELQRRGIKLNKSDIIGVDDPFKWTSQIVP